MLNKIKNIFNHRLARFVVVGFSNAALHFSVLNFGYYIFDLSKITASLVATVCAVTFSFFLNRSFVFKEKNGDKDLIKEVLLFSAVTLSGMLIIHNLTYAAFIAIVDGYEGVIIDLLKSVTGYSFSKDFIDINLATVFGAIAALVWNYNGYRLFVFKKTPQTEKADEETS